MMMKKLIYICIFSMISWLQLSADDNRYENANSLYQDGNFTEAVNAYKDILNTGVESAGLYYNLGNAYYKSGKLPEAILYYERALLLAPQDKDIQYNLEMANTQITDKLESVDTFFLASWVKSFKNTTHSDSWAIISIITFALAVLCFGIFYFSGRKILKQVNFAFAILFILIAIFAFNFSASQKDKLSNRSTAIIFSPSISIKSSPSESGTDLFILHEGTKVNIVEQVGEWSRISISDGNDGWVKTSVYEVI